MTSDPGAGLLSRLHDVTRLKRLQGMNTGIDEHVSMLLRRGESNICESMRDD